MAAFCARSCARRRAAAVEPVPVWRRAISGNRAGIGTLSAFNFVSCAAAGFGLRLVPAVSFCVGWPACVCTGARAGPELYQCAAGWHCVSRCAAAHGQLRISNDRKWRSVAAVARAGSCTRWHAGRRAGTLVVCWCPCNWYAAAGWASGGGRIFAGYGGAAGCVAAAGGACAAFY